MEKVINKKVFGRVALIPLFIIAVQLLSFSYTLGSENNYYYVHVASFREKNRALMHASNLNNAGQNSVISGETIKGLGSWYRVYVGPFSFYDGAAQKGIELKEKGMTNYTFIRKKEELIGESTKNSETITECLAPSSDPIGKKKNQNSNMKSELFIIAETDETQSSPNNHINTPEKKKSTEKNWKISLKHEFVNIKLELVDRKMETNNGTTTSVNQVSIDEDIKNSFTTAAQMDVARLQYDLNENIGVFISAGIAWDSLAEIKGLYGGGMNLNLFELEQKSFGKFYGTLTGEYKQIYIEEDFLATNNEYWEKDSDIKAYSGQLELGIKKSKYIIYGGGKYSKYREETERLLLDNVPAPFTYVKYYDKLRERNKYNFFGGVKYLVSTDLLFNIEGQYGNNKGVLTAIEYSF